jgi:hypothetical protein
MKKDVPNSTIVPKENEALYKDTVISTYNL